jgi:hypothetical protein
MRSLAWGFAGNPIAQGVLGNGCRSGLADAEVNQDGTLGPFAILRRAEEEAIKSTAAGCAQWLSTGDAHVVRVSR